MKRGKRLKKMIRGCYEISKGMGLEGVLCADPKEQKNSRIVLAPPCCAMTINMEHS